MRASQWFLATLKETPNDAEIVSHQLMVRTGMIRKLGSGLYTWMPLGLKVLRKIEQIVREEMNNINSMEVLMPAVQPAELWQETGRWDTFGGQLLTMKDSNDREYCFGPTHEEVITDIMRHELQSYKQLPASFYQIQTKFRDEIRPRFGVMRAREFIMKDAYSFHLNLESLQDTYKDMYQAYCRIFDRLGLKYRAVEADTGAIGGSASHEFQVLADSGEDLIFYSDQGDYAANIEQATSLKPAKATPTSQKITLVDTPNKKTITEVAEFLQVSSNQTVKTLIVKGKEHPMVGLILRGDDELNEVKATKHPLIDTPLQFIDEETILKNLNTPIGSLGPINLTIPIIADYHALAMDSFICGANQADKHYQHAAWDKDVKEYLAFDLRNVKDGDISPDGKGTLYSCRGIEVGHVFQLGDKYAKAMNAVVINEQGQLETMLMGCYGLGITRVVAAAIEQHHDEKGIIWPQNIAPFQLVIIPLNAHRSPEVKKQADRLYEQFKNLSIDVLIDDRNERAGVLFADHDLIGIPHRLVVSDRNIEQNCVEYKSRATGEMQQFNLDTAVDSVLKLISKS
ncbi:proline--tRNA ligase [Legionella longbeachae]|uniref:Proline--tRNA ligase n=1 Tax=Legionella longbeachae serogroup 1 (strain NSW150) TaxID=661367 RepID=D3HQH7_LEGLN|nr:proline--tRNA ligase [Legionella longbeachae]VEE01665.1 prolyl-tRNA synthetase [Legionella oakridgensis]ARB91997.1 proline--tRNA ligase [Legionella longbeachae]ARM34817.1 proline--tRNA ligase [Legionella longbeachae]EEZ95741.1 prolyl-tRNA synthetase [Legionella longbeachae D-4968]QIN31592.1 proline--tRNA ligase [Legionella longbeachae]